ncbi:3-keto-disaccharide hydrolase [Shivajiella indica]|uniref:DUF1080 domain-containing protein n=1 Tax=Shivajiella indica TaxID=872115 RepID=A0ABW5B9T0_9BACT
MIKSLIKLQNRISLIFFIGFTFNFFPVFGQHFKNTVSIFNKNSLEGWKVHPSEHQDLWKVENGIIVGGDGVQKIEENNYLYTEEIYGDFEFRCLFRLTGDASTGLINSGIQYRSNIINNNMVGYQADIGTGYWGDIYDEHRRGKLVGGDLETLKHVLSENGWNSYTIRCKGDFHEIFINGVKTGEYEEKYPDIPKKGLIAIQLHSGGNAKIEFRDLTITTLSEH